MRILTAFLLFTLFAVSCDTPVKVDNPDDNPTDSTNSVVDTIVFQNSATTWYDKLAVVYTGSHEETIYNRSDITTKDLAKAAKHARYMAVAYRQYPTGKPKNHPPLEVATYEDGGRGVWGSPENSPRAFLDRARLIHEAHNDGIVTVVMEFFKGLEWPYKGPLPSELIPGWTKEMDGTRLTKDSLVLTEEQANYVHKEAYELAYATLESLRGLNKDWKWIYELQGELWLRRYVSVRRAWCKGGADAYVDFIAKHPEEITRFRLSYGAMQYTNRTFDWAGGELAESILTYDKEVLDILNTYKGEVSMNLYPSKPPQVFSNNVKIYDVGFIDKNRISESPDFEELRLLKNYLAENYPDITLSVSETGWSSQPAWTASSKGSLVADRDGLKEVMQIQMDIISPHGRINYYAVDGKLGKFAPLSFAQDLEWWEEVSQTKL